MWAIWLIGCLLWTPAAHADQRALDAERLRLSQRHQPPLTPGEEAKLLARGWRDRRPGEFAPPVSATSRPADYQNDVHRGTIEFLPGRSGWRNYSYHAVQIPNNTVIDGEQTGGCNFTQIAPNTDAIMRSPGAFGHHLTFRHCNLTNLKTYPDWVLEDCNTTQVDRIGNLDNPDEVVIEDSVFVATRSEDVPHGRVKPAMAIK